MRVGYGWVWPAKLKLEIAVVFNLYEAYCVKIVILNVTC